MNKSWQNNFIIWCTFSSSLIEFIIDGSLKELKQFEDDFERDEVSKL